MDSPCGDWEPYKDEKCFKIFDKVGFQNYEDAEKTCLQQENSSTLVSIHSLEEQVFFSNFLFKTHNIADTVWIGAKSSSNKFKWADDSDLSFTNWAQGNPSNKTGNDCVQMVPEGSSMGKWVDEPCNKKNLVVCQNMQIWSLSRLQKTLLDARKELKDALNNLQQNPVPIGFIYAQLPSQPEPQTLWPTVEWKDVTSDYAGLFFRAEGGEAEPFGKVQYGNAPFIYIDQVTNAFSNDNKASSNLTSSGWSPYIYTGSSTGNTVAIRFHVNRNDGEIRPTNKAVRIWKRIN